MCLRVLVQLIYYNYIPIIPQNICHTANLQQSHSSEEAFGLSTVEGKRFIPEIEIIKPSQQLVEYVEEVLPIAIATGSEKVRSELIISPILIEVWKILEKQIGIFSGEEFDVDSSVGLNGRCDFLLSRSPKLIEIDAPAVVIVEAKNQI